MQDKPLTALFRYVVKDTADSGENTETTIFVSCCRDRQGNSRSDIYEHEFVNSCSASVLWDSSRKEYTMLNHESKQFHKIENSLERTEKIWMPTYDATFTDTQETKIILGIECNRISFVPWDSFNIAKEAPVIDECWVSYEYGIVLSDVLTYSDKSSIWETVEINFGEPLNFCNIDIPNEFAAVDIDELSPNLRCIPSA